MNPLYWINSNNFGNALNPILYEAITGKKVESCKYAGTLTLAIGSILHLANPNDVVWGTGAMGDHLKLVCDSTTTFKAVRGPMSAWKLSQLGIPVPKVLADPAVLIPYFFNEWKTPCPAKYLCIPHYADVDFAMGQQWYNTDFQVLSPMMDTKKLIQNIACSNGIITSSLHVLIVAEAYGVPVVWAEWSDNVAGKRFKFWDYYLSTLRVPPEPMQLRNKVLPFDDLTNSDLFSYWDYPKWDWNEMCKKLLYCCPFS